jgi:hypothetical protein
VGIYQPLRFLAALGVASVEDVTTADLQKLVDVGADETSELEFKAWPHEAGPKGTYDIAKDVSAMANAAGGVIVVGIKEAPDKKAGEIVVFPLDGKYPERVHAVMAGSVFPMPEVAVYGVPRGGSEGQYLVVIPPSPLAPHAVRGDPEGKRREPLTYWLRNGNQSTALAEGEVADRYRNRFAMARSAVTTSEALASEAATHLDSGKEGVWLVITLVPTRTGSLPRADADIESFKTWVQEIQAEGLPDAAHLVNAWTITKGVGQRIVTATSPYRGTAQSNYIELHDNGAGVLAVQQAQREGNANAAHLAEHGEGLDFLIRGQVATQVLAALFVLGRHAVRTGGGGDATVTARIVRRNAANSPGLVLLATHGEGGLSVANPEARVIQTPAVCERTFSVEALASDGRELVVATHLLAGDVFADFGNEDLFGFDAAGTISVQKLGEARTDTGRKLAAWALANGLAAG